MKKKTALPFQNMTSESWQNLALAAVFFFYLFQVGFDLISHNMCETLATDYCAYWSAGKIANNFGYLKVYDLDLLTQVEKANLPQLPDITSTFGGLPFAYLSVFVLPFQLLAFLDVSSGFWIWTIINLIVFIYYLRFFYTHVIGGKLPKRLAILLLLSFPVFMNLYLGQVNIWLMVCVGEFIRLTMSGKAFQAGIWLGGLLLKPQILIIIIPIVFLKRWKSTIVGFCFSSFWIIVVSFALAKMDGLYSLFGIFLGYSKGISTSATNIMMNWRMMGFNLSYLFNPLIGWSIAWIGSIITVVMIIGIWKKIANAVPEIFVIGILATFAATGALTWHSHLSMSLVLIPPIVYLYAKKQLSDYVISWWIFTPAVIWFSQYIVGALVALEVTPFSINWFVDFLYGISGLALNLFFLLWSINKIRHISIINPKLFPSSMEETTIS